MSSYYTKKNIINRPGNILHYKKIDWYILKKYLVTFLLTMALIIVIVITFDVSEKLDDFLGSKAPFSEVLFNYYLNFIPGFVNLYSALFIFISVIFFTSKMAGNTEVIAILGSGISYRRFLRPFLHGSLIVALTVFVFGNFVIPLNNVHLIKFEQKYIHPNKENYYHNIHFQQKIGTQVYADNYDLQNKTVFKLRIDTYDEQRRLIHRISCDNAHYDTVNNQWNCYGFFERSINGKHEQLVHKGLRKTQLPVMPSDFDQRSERMETMNSIELYKYIKREKMRGSQEVILAQIEIYQRLFTPLAIIIMTVMAVAVSSRKVRGGIGLHLAIGITLAFGYIVFMKVSTVFATNGNMPPMLAVLTPQLIFAFAAASLVRNASR